MNGLALAVGEYLEFDMARFFDIAFEQDAVLAEGVDGFALAGLQCRQESIGGMHDAHAFAAAAVRGLDHQRIADVLSLLQEVAGFLVFAAVARDDRYAVRDHQGFCPGLGAHGAHTGSFRPDEHNTCGPGHFGEFGILREKAIAGMDGLCLRGQSRIQHGLFVEITQAGFGRSDEHRFVGQSNMLGVTVGF